MPAMMMMMMTTTTATTTITNGTQYFIAINRILQDSAVVTNVQNASRRNNLIFFVSTVALLTILICLCCGPSKHMRTRCRRWGGGPRQDGTIDTVMGNTQVVGAVVPTRAMHREQRQRQRAIRLGATHRRLQQRLQLDTATDDNFEMVPTNKALTVSSMDAETRRIALIHHFTDRGLQRVLENEDFFEILEQSPKDVKAGQSPTSCSSIIGSSRMDDPADGGLNGNMEPSVEDNSNTRLSALRFLPNNQQLTQSSHHVPHRCPICLENYGPREIIVWSENPSCRHCYHQDCILDYLVPLVGTDGSRLPPCPCCRSKFLLKDPCETPTALDKGNDNDGSLLPVTSLPTD